MERGPGRRALAFAPAHLTGLFRPSTEARDPRARGSVGAGLVLEVGVRAYARLRPSERRLVHVHSSRRGSLPISTEVARRLLGSRKGALSVRLEHEVPIGQGFGTSAAGAVATGLAVAAVLGESPTRAIEIAHLADLYGGGGLGGVAAILGGGLELRHRPGIPPFGRVDHSAFSPSFLVGVLGGPISSPRVLRSERVLRRIARAGVLWEELPTRPDPEEFFTAAGRFTDRVALAPTALRALLRGLRRRGALSFQPMFGSAFAALPSTDRARAATLKWLGERGIATVELRCARTGARRLPPPADPGAPGRSADIVRPAAASLLPRGPSRRRP